MKLHKIDHVGIVVKDFATALAFFLELGLEVQGEGIAEGDWVGNVIGLQDVKVAYAMLWTPDGGANIELIHFHRPPAEEGSQQSVVNTPGIRHLAFVVEDIEAVVAKLTKQGGELVGGIQNYEDTYKLCYMRGPEGIILELAEKIN